MMSTEDNRAESLAIELQREIVTILQEVNTETPEFAKKVDFIFAHCEKYLFQFLEIRKNLQQKIIYLLTYGFAVTSFLILRVIDIVHMHAYQLSILCIAITIFLHIWNIVKIVKKGFYAAEVGVIGIEPKDVLFKDFVVQNLDTIKITLLVNYQVKIETNGKYNRRLKAVIETAVIRYLIALIPLVLLIIPLFYASLQMLYKMLF